MDGNDENDDNSGNEQDEEAEEEAEEEEEVKVEQNLEAALATKLEGNQLYKENDHQGAIDKYTLAIAQCPDTETKQKAMMTLCFQQCFSNKQQFTRNLSDQLSTYTTKEMLIGKTSSDQRKKC